MTNLSRRHPNKVVAQIRGHRPKQGIMAATASCLGAVNTLAVNPEDVLVFSKGPVTLRPQLYLTAQYSDNIFFTDANRQSDLLSIVSPGLELDFGRQANYINLDYSWDNFFYLDHDEINEDQHRLRIDSHFEANDFSVTGRDNVEFLSSILSGCLSIRGQRNDRAVFRDEYTLRYNISEKTSVYLDGLHNTVDYDHAALFDSTAWMGSAGFSWLAFPKTSLFGQLYYGQTTRSRNSPGAALHSSWNFGGFLGARGSFTEKLTGTVKAGYETREFEDGRGGATTPVVSVGLTEAFSEKSILRLTYTRQSFVSAEFVQSHLSSLLFGYEFEKFSSSHPGLIDYNVNRVTLSLALGY